jgi:hypothetical protein
VIGTGGCASCSVALDWGRGEKGIEMKIAIWDCETWNLPMDDQQWRDWLWLGISSLCIWCDWERPPHGRYHLFRGRSLVEGLAGRLDAAAHLLASADVAVTFGGSFFDVPLLSAHTDLGEVNHLDLCEEIREAHNTHYPQQSINRLSLARCIAPTLGEPKTGHGASAPDKAQQGRWCELATYNIDDVQLLLMLYQHIQFRGYCWVDNRRVPLSVPGGVGANLALLQPADWPQRPASEKQVAYIRQLMGYEWTPTQGLSMQQASQMIDDMRNRDAAVGRREDER